ncbi:MAG: ABC transporter substrate-binding protein, partial [Treponema sp.]|nr:ABC transporter substrate-binding protein [Treponema sp.]
MKRFLKVSAAALAALALAACPGDDPGTGIVVADGHPLDVMNEVLTHFPIRIDTGEAHVPGSIFQYGIAKETPLIGLIGAAVLWTEAADNIVATLLGTSSTLVGMNEFNQFSNDGVARFEFDVPSKMLRFVMQEDVRWHDGVPLTMRDLYYAYHVMAHADYSAAGGVRFSGANRNIRGIMDYHNGLADTISGLVLSDNDRALTMYFDDFSADILYLGVWTYPMPRHIFEGTPVSELPNHPQVRVNPVGWGPFKYVSHVPGESFLLERNDDYVWGRPQIEQMVVRRIEPELIPLALEAGEFDIVGFPTHRFADFQNPTNYFYMGSPGGGYSYMAFRLGHFDFDTGRNVFDAHRPMNNVHLRRAMALAADEHLLGQMLFNGLQFTAGSFLVPKHEAFMDMSVPMFGHDP